MGLSPKSNYEKKILFLVLTSGKFLEALGGGIGTGSIFCLSFSLSNRVVSALATLRCYQVFQGLTMEKLHCQVPFFVIVILCVKRKF